VINAARYAMTQKKWTLHRVRTNRNGTKRFYALKCNSDEEDRMKSLPKVLVVDDDQVIGQEYPPGGCQARATSDYVDNGRGSAAQTQTRAMMCLHRHQDARMNGLEVAERDQGESTVLPVVIITGYGTEANENAAGAAGCPGFCVSVTPDMIEYSRTRRCSKKLG